MATNYTLEMLSDLETALAAGVMRVTHGATTTEFQTRADMMAQVRLMRLELGLPLDNVPVTAGMNPIRRIRFNFRKGLR